MVEHNNVEIEKRLEYASPLFVDLVKKFNKYLDEKEKTDSKLVGENEPIN